MSTFDIKCSVCEKVLGTTSVETSAFKCSACDQGERLPVAFDAGFNIDITDLATEQPEKLAGIINEKIIDQPNNVLGLGYGSDIETAKATRVAELGLDDVAPAVQIATLVAAKGAGITKDTMTAEALASHKATAIEEASIAP